VKGTKTTPKVGKVRLTRVKDARISYNLKDLSALTGVSARALLKQITYTRKAVIMNPPVYQLQFPRHFCRIY
jgi:hypothetical protein